MFAPSQVNLLGMSAPLLKSLLEIEKDIFFPAAPDCGAEKRRRQSCRKYDRRQPETGVALARHYSVEIVKFTVMFA
jgi:hypothetical protein